MLSILCDGSISHMAVWGLLLEGSKSCAHVMGIGCRIIMIWDWEETTILTDNAYRAFLYKSENMLKFHKEWAYR